MKSISPRLLSGLALVALAACSPAPNNNWSGYAEGETVYVASPVAGRLAELAVRSGDSVQAQQALFSLEDSLERAADAEAQARAKSALAQARDTDKGRRREELAVTEAQLRQARVQAELARSELARQQALVAQGFVQKAKVDDAGLALRQAEAHVSELDAVLRSARLPAREDARNAAQALAAAAESGRAQTDWRLRQTAQRAPRAAVVTDVFYRPGEWVNAGAPVLALLPADRRKARFFVAEAQLGAIKLGQAVHLNCDGCGGPIAARISFISPQAEYTPPVIYSNAQRAKLVFMVEARPDKAEDALKLHPGQPLDVSP